MCTRWINFTLHVTFRNKEYNCQENCENKSMNQTCYRQSSYFISKVLMSFKASSRQKGAKLILRRVTLKQCGSERAQRTLRHPSFQLFSCLLNGSLLTGFHTRWHSIMWHFSPFSTEKVPNASLKRKKTDGNEKTKYFRSE